MAQLTNEQVMQIEAAVVKAARQVMIGRRLVPTPPPVGFAQEVLGYDKLTEMAKGRIDLEWGAGFSEDTVRLKRTKVPMAVLHREFDLNRRQVEASQRNGTPLPTTAIDAATYAVARQEDDLIIQGYSVDGTHYEIPGLYQGAGNSDTGADWGTATNIPVTLQEGVAKLQEDNIPGPYTLVVHPTQYNELFGLIGSYSTDMYYDYAVKRLAAVGADGVNQQGRVFSTTAVTTATCMLLGPAFLNYAAFQLGVDMKVEVTELEKSKNTWGIVYETGAVLLHDSNGICTLGC